MPLIKYRNFKFKPETLDMIAKVVAIVEEFAAQGFDMTLRQVYYQLVARDLFPESRRWSQSGGKWVRDPNGTNNALPNYSWLGDVVSDARLAGLLDWSRITDRTRNLRKLNHWNQPHEIVADASRWYNRDLWASQDYRPEVWIEKDALVGVFEDVCTSNDIPYFSCRGYTSLSEMWVAAQRLYKHIDHGYKVVIFHFGDHDPSGIDMTRDITDRLTMFMRHHWAEDRNYDLSSKHYLEVAADEVREMFEVRRMALTYDQVDEYGPPPNPVKQTDARWKRYVQETGLSESWELDALVPSVLTGLVEEGITSIRNAVEWNAALANEHQDREKLSLVSHEWDAVMAHVNSPEPAKKVDAKPKPKPEPKPKPKLKPKPR